MAFDSVEMLQFTFCLYRDSSSQNQFKMFKLFFTLSALVAVSYATVSGDYGSVGVQTEQTVRVSGKIAKGTTKIVKRNFNLIVSFFSGIPQGALNTLSSYSKQINTAHSQAFVSRTDYTNNPGVIAHAPIAAYHAPIAAAYPAAYHAPIAAAYPGAYHAPIGKSPTTPNYISLNPLSNH